jgi:hypothetical protein
MGIERQIVLIYIYTHKMVTSSNGTVNDMRWRCLNLSEYQRDLILVNVTVSYAWLESELQRRAPMKYHHNSLGWESRFHSAKTIPYAKAVDSLGCKHR